MMISDGVASRLGSTLTSGVVGVLAVKAVSRLFQNGAARNGAITATTWGLRGLRTAETGAESVRLAAADVLAEARERIGEQAPAPGAAAEPHAHGH